MLECVGFGAPAGANCRLFREQQLPQPATTVRRWGSFHSSSWCCRYVIRPLRILQNRKVAIAAQVYYTSKDIAFVMPCARSSYSIAEVLMYVKTM